MILNLVNQGQDAMPGFKDSLTDQQREDVTAYVMTLWVVSRLIVDNRSHGRYARLSLADLVN